MPMNIEQLTEYLTLEVAACGAALRIWKSKFEADPGVALDNSVDEFDHAARLYIYERVLKWIGRPETTITINSVREYALSMVLSAAKNPRLSHSATSTLFHHGVNRAWACLLDYIGLTPSQTTAEEVIESAWSVKQSHVEPLLSLSGVPKKLTDEDREKILNMLKSTDPEDYSY